MSRTPNIDAVVAFIYSVVDAGPGDSDARRFARLRLAAAFGQDIAEVEPYTGPLTEPESPNSNVHRVALELVDKYHQAKQSHDAANRAWRAEQMQKDEWKSKYDQTQIELANVKKELGEANARNTRQAETIRTIRGERDDAIIRLAQLNRHNTELGAELVKARKEVEALRGTCGVLSAKVRQLETEVAMAWSARDMWRDTVNAIQKELECVKQERDTFQRMLNPVLARIEKLRTFLQPFQTYDTVIDCSEVRKVLEETK